MWRIANCVYRAFRNTATHRCSQDVLVPLTTVYNTDDDSNSNKEEKCSSKKQCDIYQVLKNNQFSYKNIEKLQEHLKNISLQTISIQKTDVVKAIETPKAESAVKDIQSISKTEETVDSILKKDETCMKTIKELSDLHEETMSIVNLEIALNAFESGNLQLGIEALQASAKTRTNAAALYNLGICYEEGIGVEHDRAKACDYYRWAAALGHINAQYNLTRLSNHIDIDDNEDEILEETLSENSSKPLRETFFRISLSNDYAEEQSFIDNHQFILQNQTIACLS